MALLCSFDTILLMAELDAGLRTAASEGWRKAQGYQEPHTRQALQVWYTQATRQGLPALNQRCTFALPCPSLAPSSRSHLVPWLSVLSAGPAVPPEDAMGKANICAGTVCLPARRN